MRIVIALVLGFVVSLSLTMATGAEAAPTQEKETYYYSDDTFTEEVGYTYVDCDNNVYASGIQTAYKKVYWSACESSTSGMGCFVCTLDHTCIGVPCP